MARIDDYKAAKLLAGEKLAGIPFDDIIGPAGFESIGKDRFRVPFLDGLYLGRYPDFSFQNGSDPEKEVPLQEQVLILHYLEGCAHRQPTTGKWIAYREIPGASFYFAAFVKRAVDPLKKVFGQDIDRFTLAVDRLGGGKPIEPGDAGVEFTVFPHIPIQLILYAGDDEFPPEANILFDQSIGSLLSPEDVAWLAGMVVYRLMALAR